MKSTLFILISITFFALKVNAQDSLNPKVTFMYLNLDLYTAKKEIRQSGNSLFGAGLSLVKPIVQKKLQIGASTGISVFNIGKGNYFNIPLNAKAWYPLYSSGYYGITLTSEFGIRHFLTLPDYINQKTVLDYGFGFIIQFPVNFRFWPFPYFGLPISIKRIENHNFLLFSTTIYSFKYKK